MKNILLLFSILMVISSCKPNEVIKAKEGTAAYALQEMKANEIDFQWFSAKIKTSLVTAGNTQTATLQVRMEKDKRIWISGQKFGFEGLRVLIEQDSIYILNRLNKTYQVAGFSYVQEEFNLPANFQAVQDLFIGNALMLGEGTNYKLVNNANQTILVGMEDNFKATYALNKLNYNLEAFTLEDINVNRQMNISQVEYETIDERGDFSNDRTIELKNENKAENATILMSYSRVTFDEEKSMSFSVPDSYKRL